MYIRRKVYSVLTDDYGQERLFSTNEFCLDDYEDDYVDDRLFAERERGLKDAARGAGLGLGIGGLGIGAAYGARALAKNGPGFTKSAADKVVGLIGKTGAHKHKALATAAALGIPTLAAAGLAYLKGHKKKTSDNEEEGKNFSDTDVEEALIENELHNEGKIKKLSKKTKEVLKDIANNDVARGAGLGLGIGGLGIGAAYGARALAKNGPGFTKSAADKVVGLIGKTGAHKHKALATAAALGIPTLAAAGLAYLKGHKKKTSEEEGEKSFSKMEDEDYIEEIKRGAKAKKDFQKLVRKGKATAGGILGLGGGMAAGALLAERLGPGAVPIGAALGGVGGSLIGNRLGKKQQNKKEKAIDEKLQRDLDRYNNADEKDKKYLREKIKSEALRNAIISASPYINQVNDEEDD